MEHEHFLMLFSYFFPVIWLGSVRLLVLVSSFPLRVSSALLVNHYNVLSHAHVVGFCFSDLTWLSVLVN